MQIQSIHFQKRSRAAIADPETQKRMASLGFAQRRAERVTEFGAAAFEAQRDAAEAIRNRSIADLATWIERFETKATSRGATVLFASDAQEVGERVIEICRRHDLKKAIKSKSMLSEEADLNRVLAAAGVQPVETDLGEYICQLADDPPSHIIAPAMHKSQDEIADLFVKHHGTPRLDRAGLAGRTRRYRLGHGPAFHLRFRMCRCRRANGLALGLAHGRPGADGLWQRGAEALLPAAHVVR